MNADATQMMIDTDCGHTVPKSQTVSVPEIILCRECYTPFDVTEWPQTIGKYEYRAREKFGTSKESNEVYIIGLDRRGRAKYYDEDNRRVLTYVPKHDTAYQQDRHERQKERDKSNLRPRKNIYCPDGPAPMQAEEFVTLPNGDHIVEVEVSDKLSMGKLKDWIQENCGDWKQVHPDVVKRIGIDGFGPTSGERELDFLCRECYHLVRSLDPADADRCPECDSHKFYHKPEESDAN